MGRTVNPNQPLSPRALRYVAELLAHPAGTQTDAAIRAGYASRNASVTASQLMADPRVKRLIGDRREQLIRKLEIRASDVLEDVLNVITADPRDLTEYHIGCCRYCWGDGNMYQRTPQEYRDAVAAYRKTEDGAADPLCLRFDHLGGVGFNRHTDPNPNCPECFGDGEGRTVIKDTRRLNPAARAFYAGVKETRHGVEVSTRSKDKAIELAARHTGVVRSGVEVTGKGGGPVQHATTGAVVALTTTDPIEAAREYQKLMGT